MAVFPAGHILTSADLDTLFPTGVGAWTPYTPTLTQSATVTKTVSAASYAKAGRKVSARFYLIATGAGTAGNAVVVGLPVAALFGAGATGPGYLYDASAATFYTCQFDLASTTTARLLIGTATNYAGVAGGGFTAAMAAGDVISGILEYEAAS